MHRLHATNKLLHRFGRTAGCPLCEKVGSTHNVECRLRIERALIDSGEGLQVGESVVEVKSSLDQIQQEIDSVTISAQIARVLCGFLWFTIAFSAVRTGGYYGSAVACRAFLASQTAIQAPASPGHPLGQTARLSGG